MTWTTRQRSEVGGHPAVVSGQGTPVLLLHGVGLRAEAWGAQIDDLSRNARVIAPDMAGHGQSRLPSTLLHGIEDYVAAAETVLHALDRPAVLVGHSMGAMVALALAARWPGRVTAVAALNAVFERTSSAEQAVKARASALDGVTPVDPTPTLTRWFGDQDTPERAACSQWLRNTNPAAYRMAYTAFAESETPTRAQLVSLRCPSIFITGSAEPNSTPAMSCAMAELAPSGLAIVVDGAAHMMPMTHPEEVNAVLRDLVRRVGT